MTYFFQWQLFWCWTYTGDSEKNNRLGLECEIEQFHSRVHIVNSETRLAQPLMNENVNLRVELSDLILLTITDYFSLIIQQRIRNLYVQLENGRHWRKYLTSKLCNLMKNKYCIFKMTVCILVWFLCYKTESISTVVYSLKRSQVHSILKVLVQ